MAYITGTTADIVEAQKEARSSLYGGKKWEEYFLQPTQQYYQAAGESVQQQTAYDISQAYANYKQQELALLQQQQLGTGFKEQQASALQSQYGQTYSGLKTTELQNLMNIESQYQATVAKEEERLAKQATQYKKLDRAVQEYFNQHKDRIVGFEDVGSFEDLYTTDETGSKILTDRGRLAYEAVLKGGDIDTSQYDDSGKRIGDATTYSFDEYLQETDEELYEMYLDDPGFAQQILGGSEYEDFSYSEEEKTQASELQLKSKNDTRQQELGAPNKTFSNETERSEYLDKYETFTQNIDANDLMGDLDRNKDFMTQVARDIFGTSENSNIYIAQTQPGLRDSRRLTIGAYEYDNEGKKALMAHKDELESLGFVFEETPLGGYVFEFKGTDAESFEVLKKLIL